MAFTTEGVLYWLPDINKWVQTVKHLLNETGVLYVPDSHPFYMIFDKEKLYENKLAVLATSSQNNPTVRMLFFMIIKYIFKLELT
jgi:hypothetical protein